MIYRASPVWADASPNTDDPSKISFDHDFAFLKINKLSYGKADCLKNYPAAAALCQTYPDVLPSSFPSLPIGNPAELYASDSVTALIQDGIRKALQGLTTYRQVRVVAMK